MGADVIRISPAEAYERMQSQGFTYVDVRSAVEFAEGRPADAINVPLDDSFLDRIEDAFTKDARIVVGCQTGVRSLRAARILIDAGFTNVVEQRAGFDAARGPFGEVTEPGWSRLDLPLAP